MISWPHIKVWLHSERVQLTTMNPSNRRWQMPVAAALSSGFPLLIGAYFGHMDYGLISSLGGLVFLYLPNTPLSHRMMWIMACAFGMVACYALGVMSHFFTPVMMWMLVFIAILVTMVCRFYGVGPPGSLFFVMVAAIGAYTPGEVIEIPLKVGLFTLGALLACLIAFLYSVYSVRRQETQPVPPLPEPTFDFVVFDSVVIGLFVGVSLALAQLLQLDRPYWVPVSCLAVIQGTSLRAVWQKQLHRVLGTCVGLLLSWGLLMLPLDTWRIAFLILILAFMIETLIVRHYGFAVVFVTPLTLFLAEAATLGHASPSALIQSRFLDTVLGCIVGLAGAMCLHSPRFRHALGTQLRRLAPPRFLR